MGSPAPQVAAQRKPRRRRVYWRWCVLILLVLLVTISAIVVLGCSHWLPYAIAQAPNAGQPIAPAQDPDAAQLAKLGVTHQLRLSVGPPAASLSIWVIDPAKSPQPATATVAPRGTILLLHGIRDQKTSLLDHGRHLAKAGYRSVLVDLRGHGRSTGDWLSYGVIESRDLRQVLDALDSQGLLQQPVGVMGFSYGAATGLQLAAADSRVKTVVAVSSFTDLPEIVPAYVRFFLPVVGRCIPHSQIERSVAEAGRLGGFDPTQAAPLRAITQTQAHVLLIHSRGDERIPWQHSQRLHDAAPDHSRLILLDNGAGHNGTSASDEANREILAWLRQWL